MITIARRPLSEGSRTKSILTHPPTAGRRQAREIKKKQTPDHNRYPSHAVFAFASSSLRGRTSCRSATRFLPSLSIPWSPPAPASSVVVVAEAGNRELITRFLNAPPNRLKCDRYPESGYIRRDPPRAGVKLCGRARIVEGSSASEGMNGRERQRERKHARGIT